MQLKGYTAMIAVNRERMDSFWREKFYSAFYQSLVKGEAQKAEKWHWSLPVKLRSKRGE